MKPKKTRSAGSLHLGRLGLADEDLAVRMGCKREQIAYWRTGARVPRAPARAQMLATFGIPVEAWDQAPEPTAPMKSTQGRRPRVELDEPDPPKTTITMATVTEMAARLVRLAQHGLDALELDTDMTPVERFKLMTHIHSLLVDLGKYTGETQVVPESKLVRMPAFRNIAERIVEALRRWPEAQLAVADELDAVGDR